VRVGYLISPVIVIIIITVVAFVAAAHAVGERVMLSTKNIRMRTASKKLTDRYVGPFTILEAVGKNAYKLDLLKTYGRIHPTFQVSLLERYQRRDNARTPEPIEVD
jgi:hypothetical protein